MPKITLKNTEHTEQISKKSGKPYTSCKLTVFSQKENKDIFISGFGSAITKTWGMGDVVDVDLTQNEKGYWNFDPNKDTLASPDKVMAMLNKISEKLDLLLVTKTLGGEVDPVFAPKPNDVRLFERD